MDIVVLGGGVVGVTSAWYLAKAGHKVTLLERRDGVALKPAMPMRVRSPRVMLPPGLPPAFPSRRPNGCCKHTPPSRCAPPRIPASCAGC